MRPAQGTATRPDWRDTVRVAADVAVLGLLVAAACAPVVTAGAAVATGSAAVHHHLTHDRWPGPGAVWAVFRRSLLPGLAAVGLVAAAAFLLALDVAALDSGAVPGGAALVAVTAGVAGVGAGYAGLAVVALGRRAGRGWLAAAREAAGARPAAVAASAGVLALASLLAVLVHPVLAACLTGYTLHALHAVATRTGA